jgi:hypothetical protein
MRFFAFCGPFFWKRLLPRNHFACKGSGVRVPTSPPLKSCEKSDAVGFSNESSGEGRGRLTSSFFVYLRHKWGELWGELMASDCGALVKVETIALKQSTCFQLAAVLANSPTGIEPVIRGPGRSRRIRDSPFLYGFSRFRVLFNPFESRRVSRNPSDGC